MYNFPFDPMILPMMIAYRPDCDPRLRTWLPGLTMWPIKLI